jgi:hypothetical protein
MAARTSAGKTTAVGAGYSGSRERKRAQRLAAPARGVAPGLGEEDDEADDALAVEIVTPGHAPEEHGPVGNKAAELCGHERTMTGE